MKELNYGRKSTNGMIRRSSNILNSTSKLLVVMVTIVVIIYILKNWEPKDPYGFVDLQMRFKHYVVSDKYQEDEDTYVIRLVNPVTGNEYKAYITDYLYMNVYFVGDTIK
jgi:hypothetical protein